MTILETQGQAAKQAARTLSVAGSARKDAALEAIAAALKRAPLRRGAGGQCPGPGRRSGGRDAFLPAGPPGPG